MNSEGRAIHRPVAFNNFAGGIHQHQVRGFDLAEVHAERVYPETLVPFRVAGGDVSGYALIEAELGE